MDADRRTALANKVNRGADVWCKCAAVGLLDGNERNFTVRMQIMYFVNKLSNPNFMKGVSNAINRAMYGSDPIFNKFDIGSIILTEDIYVKFVCGQPRMGREMPDAVDSGSFIAPSSEIDAIIKDANGDPALLEKILGFDAGHFKGKKLWRLDIFDPAAHDLRKPTATSGGANSHFIQSSKPWGETSGGTSEAFISVLPMSTTMIMSDGDMRIFQNVTATCLPTNV